MKTKLFASLAVAALLVLGAVYLIVRPGGNADDAAGGAGSVSRLVSQADEAKAVAIAASLKSYATGAMANFVPEAAPAPVPDISFSDAEGASHDLSLFRGKLVVLNLWATWCGPCRHEMPTLDQLEGEIGGDRVAVVALSVDQTGLDDVKKFFAGIKVSHLAIYNDPTAAAGLKFKAIGLPTTVLISPDGLVLGRFVGPAEWNAPEAKSLISAAAKAYAAD